MRLSDVRGERTLEVIADIIEPLARIAKNPDVMRLFDGRNRPEGMTDGEYFANRAVKAIPAMLRDNRADVIEVLAAIDGVDPADYLASLTMPKLLRDVYETVTDDGLLSFLSPSEAMTDTASLGSV